MKSKVKLNNDFRLIYWRFSSTCEYCKVASIDLLSEGKGSRVVIDMHRNRNRVADSSGKL